MAIALDSPRRPAPKPKGRVPDRLIYEIMDGTPIYRKGYRDVVSGKKTIEEIIGASTLQSVIISHLMKVIFTFLDEDNYFVLTGESGVHLDHRNNLANAMTENGYLFKKTRKLFSFGVQRIIWVLTDAQVVIIATPERTETVDWNTDVELMDGHRFNIGVYLAKKEISVT